MGTNFQQEASQKFEPSIGSLLFDAFCAGASELTNTIQDGVEAASELYTYHHEKQQQRLAEPESFSLGMRKSLNTTFGNNAQGLFAQAGDIQKRYLDFGQNLRPSKRQQMALAA